MQKFEIVFGPFYGSLSLLYDRMKMDKMGDIHLIVEVRKGCYPLG